MVEIKAVQKVSLLDYPGKVSAIIFLGGCNFRCPFCYNVDIVLNPEKLVNIDEKIVLEFLKKRKKFLDGVCITGGEPTIHKDLPEFIRKIKALGLLVKLDTNGYMPEMLEKLFDEKLRALKGSKRYVLQQFLNDKKMIDKRFNKVKPYPQKVLEKFLKLVQPFFKEVELRA
ncbi:anaerobic ribonucleoside-triphosphate reductase activating protein [Candidatus Pacearchaeota archaeon ex4484_31]|nr:MAG: anaerobic ribonucleoside-triphosphate reductase activating protein [Candidatus Pacearchaeota archaeon ex4484_31]